MTDKNLTRRRVLEAAASSSIAIVPASASAKEIAARPDESSEQLDDLHENALPHDIGVFNNWDTPATFEIQITNDQGSDYEQEIELKGLNDPDTDNSKHSRFIGMVTVPGRYYHTIEISAVGQSVSSEVLLDETGIVEFGSIGIYLHPDGTLDAMWSMA